MLRRLLFVMCLLAVGHGPGCNSKTDSPATPAAPAVNSSSVQPQSPPTAPPAEPAGKIASPDGGSPSSGSPAAAPTSAAPSWIADLAHDDAAIRDRASAELSKRPMPAEFLIPWLNHSETAVRRGAAFGMLGQLDTRDAKQTAAIEAALADTDETVRRVALHAVSQWSQDDPVAAESAVGPLEAIVSNASRDTFERSQAVRILGRLGSAAQPALIRTFSADADANVRKAALAAAMRTAPAAEAVVKPLIGVLGSDSNAAMRRQAALHLKDYAKDRTVQQALAAAFTDADSDVRLEAATSLAHAGAAALDFTTSLLDDPSPQVRVYAVFALGKMGRAAEPAVAKLRRLTSDPDSNVAKTAAGVIRVIESSP